MFNIIGKFHCIYLQKRSLSYIRNWSLVISLIFIEKNLSKHQIQDLVHQRRAGLSEI